MSNERAIWSAVAYGDLDQLKKRQPFTVSMRNEHNQSLLTFAVLKRNDTNKDDRLLVEWLLNQGVLDTPDYYTKTAYDYAYENGKGNFAMSLYARQLSKQTVKNLMKKEIQNKNSALRVHFAEHALFDAMCLDVIAGFI